MAWPSAVPSPAPAIVIRADTSPEWWQIVLDVMVAWGTVGAVVAAAVIAVASQRNANSRAEKDREEFSERQREEREHDRWMADVRWRLDLLLRLSEAFEHWQAVVKAGRPAEESRAAVVALVRAYPGGEGVLWRWLVAETPESEFRAVAQQYGPVPDGLPLVELARHELQHRLDEVQRELRGMDFKGSRSSGSPAPSGRPGRDPRALV